MDKIELDVHELPPSRDNLDHPVAGRRTGSHRTDAVTDDDTDTAAAAARRPTSGDGGATATTSAVPRPVVQLNGVRPHKAIRGKSLKKLLGCDEQPYLWGMSGLVDANTGSDWARIASADRDAPGALQTWSARIQGWVDAWSNGRWTIASAGAAVLVARRLPRLARCLTAPLVQQLLDQLVDVAWAETPSMSSSSAVSADTAAADAAQPIKAESAALEPGANLIHQWLKDELPMLLAHWLAPSDAASTLNQLGRNRLVSQLREQFDGEGQPLARNWPWLRAHWASLTFSLAVASADHGQRGIERAKVAKEARLIYSWLTRQALRATRPDGRTSWAADTGGWDELLPLADAALMLEGDAADQRIVDGWRAELAGEGPSKSQIKGRRLPRPGDHSEWAETGLLRGGWHRDALVCGVRYDRRSWKIELMASGQLLLQGDGMPTITVDGRLLHPTDDWESTCWEIDGDVEYLELEMHFEGQWRVQRQLGLARREQQLFVADAVLGPGPAMIEYASRLPMAPGVRGSEDSEATEIRLGTDRDVATVLPLALSEWKQALGANALDATTGQWRQTARASSTLFAPLVISIDRGAEDGDKDKDKDKVKEKKNDLTWRQLTVAENLEIVSHECAVAYRYRIGDRQWVVYRALTSIGNRTFLGRNVNSEFFWGRFHTSGDAETLVEIE